MYCLGIDTSNYTTSLAVIDSNMKLAYEGRRILDVPEGSRGLRQSDAHFQHTNNIPELLKQCFKKVEPRKTVCICVSSRPRNTVDSYMPVFTAGTSTAKILGLALQLPVFEVSHQENHIVAGIWSSTHEFSSSFLAYHISGGTTELLQVGSDEGFSLVQIGGSSDLKAGQFIDRVGVAMGLKFPCGQAMDNLCDKYDKAGLKVPVSVDGSYTSFSGPETYIQRLLSKQSIDEKQKSEVSRGVFECIAESLEKTVINSLCKHNCRELLMVGGVASNKIIREYLKSSESIRRANLKVIFSDPGFSPDNAVGAAVCGMKRFLGYTEE